MSDSEEYDEEEGTQKEMSFVVPSADRRQQFKEDGKKKATKDVLRLRACLSCHVILGEQQFLADGCPNCEYLNLSGQKDLVQECTSTSFEGILTIIHPNISWVARYHNIREKVPGCYAMAVHGTLPDNLREAEAED